VEIEEKPCYKCGTLVAGEMGMVKIRINADGQVEEFRGRTPSDPVEFLKQGYGYASICPECNNKVIQTDINLVKTLAQAGEMDTALDWQAREVEGIYDDTVQLVVFVEQYTPDSDMLPALRKLRDNLAETLREIRKDDGGE